jgi:hypothetical protein
MLNKPSMVCRGCDTEKVQARWGQWWHLQDYYGFRGSFCGECYDKIAHDAQGRPTNPGEHLLMTLRLLGEQKKITK